MVMQASLSHPDPAARKNTQPPNILDSFHPPNVPKHVNLLLTKAGLVTGGCTGAELGSMWRDDIFNNHRPRAL